MLYPSIGQYTEAIKLAAEAPEDYFATLTTLRAVLDDNGNPVMSSGNFAVVFKMQDTDGKIFALKCFTRDQEGRNESYRLIADELKDVSSPYITNIQYLEKELFVDTNTDDNEFPVLLMDWVEGETLDKYIKNHISEPLCLEMLACDFAYLADWLLKQPFAHGDLKPDNILVKDDGSLVLIDYDGMYVPKMRGQKARELGSPDFRHPQRTEDDFDEHIDDFAVVTILLSIKALSLNNNLLDTLNAKDCVLLHTQDFSNLAQSAANQKLQELICDKFFARIYAMFVVVLAEKVMDMAMLESVVGKMDRDEVEYQYAQNLYCKKLDEGKAYSIFEKLSASGHIGAQVSLADCLIKGVGCKKNIDRGCAIVAYFAYQGNAKAQNILGSCYEDGQGVKKDEEKAFEWYCAAAKQDDAMAQYNVARCMDYGIWVPFGDNDGATEWYIKSAYQGNADAQNALGERFYNGWYGLEKNLVKSVEWWTKSAKQGNADAQYSLGNCYYYGQGVAQNHQKAIEWYSKVFESGNIDDLVSKMIKQGNIKALLDIGDSYISVDYNLELNPNKAINLYKKIVEYENVLSTDELCFCYWQLGNAYESDLKYGDAFIWYFYAAELGNADAQRKLDYLCKFVFKKPEIEVYYMLTSAND